MLLYWNPLKLRHENLCDFASVFLVIIKTSIGSKIAERVTYDQADHQK
jgi:hypothetical protein